MSMKLGDLLQLAGPRKLNEFPWGASLVGIFNTHLEGHLPAGVEVLTAEVSAEDAREALLHLPTDDLLSLLGAEFDMSAMQLKVAEAAPAAVAPVAPVKPPQALSPTAERKAKTKSTLALMFGGTLCAIALFIAIASSATAYKTGEMPDSSALTKVAEIMGEVLKAYSAKPTDPTQPTE